MFNQMNNQDPVFIYMNLILNNGVLKYFDIFQLMSKHKFINILPI